MWRGVLFVVARHVDLTPAAEVRLAELFRAAGRVGRRAVTGPHGIVDLGSGDTVWTDPDTGDQHSVRDEAALAAVTRELVRVDGERLSQVIADAQALLDQVDGLGGVLAAARADLDSLGMGDAEAVEQVVAERLAGALGSFLQINTEQLAVTENAYLGRAFAEQIAASLAAFELLVITASQLAPDVGSSLDLEGNPALADVASGTDLAGLEQRVDEVDGSVQAVRNAVVIEPTGITITDGQADQNAVTISNSRVGFVAGGYEVAWIDGSEQQMVIRDVAVSGGTTVGRHRIEVWSGDLTVVRWVG